MRTLAMPAARSNHLYLDALLARDVIGHDGGNLIGSRVNGVRMGGRRESQDCQRIRICLAIR
jgi:hypothetical protein